MNASFAKTLRKLRKDRGLTQEQLGKKLFVTHFTITHWEKGTRLPSVTMIPRLAALLETDANTLLQLAAKSEESPNVILVDDSKLFLAQGLAVLEEVMPNALVSGFIWPLEAIEYAKANCVNLAVLDIELGTANGLDLCKTLLEINPRTNIVFLTAYAEYAIDAWATRVCGFMVKPITPEGVKEQLMKLRYPLSMGGEET